MANVAVILVQFLVSPGIGIFPLITLNLKIFLSDLGYGGWGGGYW